jgi:hypothetical protein
MAQPATSLLLLHGADGSWIGAATDGTPASLASLAPAAGASGDSGELTSRGSNESLVSVQLQNPSNHTAPSPIDPQSDRREDIEFLEAVGTWTPRSGKCGEAGGSAGVKALPRTPHPRVFNGRQEPSKVHGGEASL